MSPFRGDFKIHRISSFQRKRVINIYSNTSSKKVSTTNVNNSSNTFTSGVRDGKRKTVMRVFGTRPEAIKMCPLVNELKTRPSINTVVTVTGQHREMLQQVLDVFHVTPDYDLHIMKQGQTLFDITTTILNSIKAIL